MAYAQKSSFSPRRALVFLAIVMLHVGFVYVLNAGLAQQAVERVFGPIETKIIEETKEEKKEPPPPPPKMDVAPPPFVPPPEVAIDLPVDAPATKAISASTEKPVPKPPPPVAAVAKTPAKPTKRSMEEIPEYPPQSKRLGEEGSTTLHMYCNMDGRVTESTVAESSGFQRLDEASMKWATRTARCTPATEGGKPVASWFDFRVKWEIKTSK
jgi:protein TonB